jgi:16S rRNA (guanine(1405)-N(7))-methyltransferase
MRPQTWLTLPCANFCERAMRSHASTRERLPDLDEFYAGVMQRTGALESVLDVACGLNPLALPWMGLPAGGRYLACDIYTDMVSFLNKILRPHRLQRAGVHLQPAGGSTGGGNAGGLHP